MSIEINGPDVPRGDEVLTDAALELVALLHREIDGRRKELLAKREERAGRAGRRRHAGLPGADEGRPRGRLAGLPSPARAAQALGRDHRPDVGQDGHQRAELGLDRLHGRLRGRQLAVVDEHGRRPGEPDGRRPRHAGVRRRGQGQAVPPERRDGHAAGAPARLAPGGAPPDRGRRAGGRRADGLRPVHPPQRARRCSSRAAARSSTCRRWSRTWRRGCGTTP